MIDPPKSFEIGCSRAAFARIMEKHLGTGKLIHNTRVRVAWQTELDPSQEDCIPCLLSKLQESDISYPLLIKTNSAISSTFAHTLSVIYNYEGLASSIASYSEPLVVQEFINHDATVYKIYCIGSYIRYYPRKSCANIKNSAYNSITFLSNQPWPAELLSCGSAIVRKLDIEVVVQICDMVRDIADVSLFGVDVLVHADSLDYVLVDMNPFPGYKEYTDLDNLMDQHCLQTYERHRREVRD